MKIQYCSDLHLEFKENNDFLIANPLQPVGDILILAGDIVPFAYTNRFNDFFDYVSENFKTSFWLPGNHEYYNYNIVNKAGDINEQIRDNVFIVNNRVEKLENIKLVFTTLWTNISTANKLIIQQRLNDFKLIKFYGSTFTPDIYNAFHQESLDFLKEAISEKDDYRTIVVSHHVPTLSNYPEKYKQNVLNDVFAVELFDLIESSEIDYWIYGHQHYNADDFKIGNTWLLTNQLGYVKNNEHRNFDTQRILKI